MADRPEEGRGWTEVTGFMSTYTDGITFSLVPFEDEIHGFMDLGAQYQHLILNLVCCL